MILSKDQILAALPDALQRLSLDLPGWEQTESGKVRESWRKASSDLRLLVTTDRISAFDRVLGVIPFKGQVLNQLSAWWFERTRTIVPNHFITAPDPNVTLARQARPLSVEVVVRGYITGVTSTSLWKLYEAGERAPYGVPLPEGLRKNDPLPQPILTPTTKALDGAHDEPLSREDILKRGLVAPDLWAQIEAAALALFAAGQEIAKQAGLILVDTKYEFGLIEGKLALIDEIHTPDSSRYWVAETLKVGSEPEHYDKEYLRRWYAAQGYRGEGTPPPLSPDLIAEVTARYVGAYERLTGLPFNPGETPISGRIARNLRTYLEVHP